MKLYVRNINFKASDAEVKALFEEYGDVSDFKIIKDKESGKSRGFGFVTIDNKADALRAISQLNGSDFQGRNLHVAEAQDRTNR